jgi:hypothetical protein
MVEFMAIKKVEMEIHETQHLMVLPKLRLFWKEKVPRQLVESLHINTMVMSYNMHFVANSTDRKHVT